MTVEARKASVHSLLLFLVLSMLAPLAAAETRYISGEVKVNMRKGQGTDYAINAVLTTDDRVTVLGEDSKSGYTRIRTENGRVGYVLSRFLTSTAPASERLAMLEERLATLETENAELQASLEGNQTALASSAQEQNALSRENEKLKKRLQYIEETSANAVEIGDENQLMRERLLVLEAEVARLEQQNSELKTWYKGQNSGAMILAIGLIIGMVFGRLRRRGAGAWSSSDRL